MVLITKPSDSSILREKTKAFKTMTSVLELVPDFDVFKAFEESATLLSMTVCEREFSTSNTHPCYHLQAIVRTVENSDKKFLTLSLQSTQDSA